ncbi:MAG: hypothetical protein ACI9BD_000543 [Candidatus Marinamargulisbacteria bacterium]|jgi:hypothetical protein
MKKIIPVSLNQSVSDAGLLSQFLTYLYSFVASAEQTNDAVSAHLVLQVGTALLEGWVTVETADVVVEDEWVMLSEEGQSHTVFFEESRPTQKTTIKVEYSKVSFPTPYHKAAFEGNEDAVGTLIVEAGNKSEVRALIEEEDADGQTALCIATAGEKVTTAWFLVSYASDQLLEKVFKQSVALGNEELMNVYSHLLLKRRFLVPEGIQNMAAVLRQSETFPVAKVEQQLVQVLGLGQQDQISPELRGILSRFTSDISNVRPFQTVFSQALRVEMGREKDADTILQRYLPLEFRETLLLLAREVSGDRASQKKVPSLFRKSFFLGSTPAEKIDVLESVLSKALTVDISGKALRGLVRLQSELKSLLAYSQSAPRATGLSQKLSAGLSNLVTLIDKEALRPHY